VSASRLRIALAKGRLWDAAIARFARAGMAPVSDKGRRLLVPSEDAGIEFLEIKPGDVPIYVESGAADLGITGTDVLREANPDVLEPLELDFGQCRLVVAAPAGAAYPALPGGITPRLATKYPRLAREHFAAQGRAVEIIEVGGSVEVAPLQVRRTVFISLTLRFAALRVIIGAPACAQYLPPVFIQFNSNPPQTII